MLKSYGDPSVPDPFPNGNHYTFLLIKYCHWNACSFNNQVGCLATVLYLF